jgi:ribose transport system ATP-binding protein
MGENGAGKSTLMKVAGGVVRPDAGSVQVAGRPVLLSSPRDAARAGIQVVFQELTVLDDLDVAQNLLVGDLPVRRGAVDRKALYARAAACWPTSGSTWTRDPGRAAQRRVASSCRDRPAVAAAAARAGDSTNPPRRWPKEEEVLFALVDRLRKDGVGIAYISHRMSEVFALATG